MTFIDLFAGIGGFRRGMELAGHKCVGFCEWDKFATASYTSMHLITDEQREYLSTLDLKKRQKEILKDEYRNGEWYADDIRNVDATSVPKCDCWCFGAPCLVAGTLITTIGGMKPIESVEVGDYVLTHANTWERVTERMVNKKTGIYTVRVKGSPKTEVTGNHRFYVRYRKRVWSNRTYHTEWSEPEWKAVEDFDGDEYVAFPVNYVEENPKGITPNEAWLIGRYVADGYLRDEERKDRPSRNRRVIFCVGRGKEQEFEAHGDFGYSQGESCRKYQAFDKRLFELCLECGKGAINKRIPWFIQVLPKELLSAFIDGYMSGDGCVKNGLHKVTSISKELVYQLGQCVSRVYGCGYGIYYHNQPEKYIIEGRVVNQHDTWHLTWRDSGEKQSVMLDGMLWQRLKKVTYEKDRTEFVYNLEVENEHSYTANNMGLHNCQDFSVAGKRAGLDGDRSSLVREVFRILKEIREEDRPEWLIYENVKGMLSSNRGFDYLAILLEMDELGYDLEWFTFNSKYHGVPQNRERVYTVGHLRSRGSTKIFPIEGTSGENNICGIDIIGHRDGYRRNTQVFSENGITEALDTGQGGGREPHTAIPMFGIDKNVQGTELECANALTAREDRGVSNFKQTGTAVAVTVGYDRGLNEITSGAYPTCNARDYKGVNFRDLGAVCIPVLTPDRAEKRQNGRRFKDNGEEAFTLTAQDRHGVTIEVKPEVIGGVGKKNFGKQYREGNRVYDGTKVATALKASNVGNAGGETNLYSMPLGCLRNVRSEYGKEIRKQYESGEINISRHEFLEKEIRQDGVSNTVDSVQKDNLLAVGIEDNQRSDHPGIYVQLSEDCTVYAVWYEKYGCYIAIRKLTPRECFRLQGWTDDYFEKAQFVNSDSQLYKQAGNGVTVNVVYEIGKAIAESEGK